MAAAVIRPAASMVDTSEGTLQETASSDLAARWSRGGVALVILLAAALRCRVLDAPLQRDEGEYAYGGQLLLDSVPPYAELYNMKLPGMYAAYAAVMASLGDTAQGIHLGLLVVNALAIVLVFAIGRRLLGDLAGFAAALVFASTSIVRGVQGVFANAEHFLLVPVLAGVFVLLRDGASNRRRSIAGAGLLFGIGILLKQHGAVFAVFGAFWIGWTALRNSFPFARIAASIGVFSIAVATPVAVTALLLVAAGVFDAFWLWTVEYAWAYTGHMDLAGGFSLLGIFGSVVRRSAPALFGLAALGIVAIGFDAHLRGRAVFLLAFLGFSVAAVALGLNFRPHYFLLVLPAVSLLAGGVVDALARALAGRTGRAAGTAIASAVVVGASVATVLADPIAQREITPDHMTRVTFGYRNPFAESRRIADFITRLADDGDRIAVFGSEPQICFYARIRCATGIVYMYPLMEDHVLAGDMQSTMIDEIESADPEWFVYADVPESWLDSSRFKAITKHGSAVMRWFEQRRRSLDRVFVVELDPTGPRYLAGPSLRGHRSTPNSSVVVYRRSR